MRIVSRFIPTGLLLAGTLFLAACDSVEERAEKHYQSALALIEEGDLDRAIVELRNVFELDSRRIDARRTLADLHLRQGNERAAYAQFATLAELEPTDAESRIILSEMAFDFGSWEEMDRHGANAAELAPEDPRVKAITVTRAYREASTAQNTADRLELVAEAETLLAENPDNLLLRNVIMDASVRKQNFTRALEELDWMIARNPTRIRNYQERLRVLAMLGDRDAIEVQLRELIEVFPEDDEHKATLIRYLISQKDLDGAEAFLRELAKAAPPEQIGLQADLIRFLAQTGNMEAAREELSRAISERPDPLPFLIIEAGFDFAAGKRNEAIAQLEDVLERSEPTEDGKMTDQTKNVKVVLARMLLQTGNEVGARTHVEELLADTGTHPEGLKLQAAWQIEADETDVAIGNLRLVLDQKPEDADAMTLMARAYSRAGQTDLERDFMAQAAQASGHAPAPSLRYAQRLVKEKRYLPAEDVLLKALRNDPSNIQILVSLGQVYLRLEDSGRLGSVINSLRRTGEQAAIQAANELEAENFNQKEGMDAAITFLEGLSNGAEGSDALQLTLLRAKISAGDTEGALSLAKELLVENPEDRALRVVMAIAHTAAKDYDAATEIYRGLVEEEPRLAGIWVRLSQLSLLKGEREEARATVDQGLTHAPTNPDLLWAKASLVEVDGDIDAAIEIYETLYEQNSNSIVVANNLASLLSTHRTDEESLSRAWAIGRRLSDFDIPAFQDTYGWILHLRGGSKEAVPILESAVEGLPNDPIVRYHLAHVLLAEERREDALEQFRKAVELAGEIDTSPRMEEARGLIQTLQESEPEPAQD